MLSAVTDFSQLKINMVSSPPMQRCFWQPWLSQGRGFRSAIACHIWDSPKIIRTSKNFKILPSPELEECASEPHLTRNPNPNGTAQQFPQPSPAVPKQGAGQSLQKADGEVSGGMSQVKGIRSGHSVPAASQLSGHTVSELCAGVWMNMMLWEIHTQTIQ